MAEQFPILCMNIFGNLTAKSKGAPTNRNTSKNILLFIEFFITVAVGAQHLNYFLKIMLKEKIAHV